MKKVFIGPNSLSQLSNVLNKLAARNALVFTLKSSFGPFQPVLESQLGNLVPQYYSDFAVNPKVEDIQDALKILTRPYDVIIAFGTGSEATQFAVLYMDGEKYSVDDRSLLPDYAFIDGTFSQNTPPYIKACSVMDAFSQAIESYWACGATPISENYALQALNLLHNKIVPYVCGECEVNAQNIAKASHLAGKAINISRTTAAHALSYTITSLYGIPHGHAVALSLPKFFQLHANTSIKSYKEPRKYAIFRRKINTLMEVLGIPPDDIIFYFSAIYEKNRFGISIGKPRH